MKKFALHGPKFRLICLFLLITTDIFSLAFAEEFRYDSHKKRDPFIALESGSAGDVLHHGEFRLEGVILDQVNGSYAIVNGEVVKEGAKISGYTIKKIESNRVLFEKEGEGIEVILREDDELLKKQFKEGKL